jgi:hypothetical protein
VVRGNGWLFWGSRASRSALQAGVDVGIGIDVRLPPLTDIGEPSFEVC